jgi:hypothetical protein
MFEELSFPSVIDERLYDVHICSPPRAMPHRLFFDIRWWAFYDAHERFVPLNAAAEFDPHQLLLRQGR